MNAKTQKPAETYFDSVMYARAFIKEVKIIEPKNKKAKKYCALNASIIDIEDGKQVYRTIDLIVKGKFARETLWNLRQLWPKDRFKREGDVWIADINIGSLSHKAFKKKNGDPGASLKGRLINIRNLRIGSEDIVGEISGETPPAPIVVTPCYVNQVNMNKGSAKVGMLDGKVSEPNTQNVNLTFEGIEAFDKLAEQNLCPKGYKYRDSNANIFAIVELSQFRAEGFQNDDGDYLSCLRAALTGVRYMKVDDTVFVSGKQKDEAEAEVEAETA